MNNEVAINIYLSTIKSHNKINNQAEKKQTHIYREHFDGCQMGGRLGVKGVIGLRSTNWLFWKGCGDVREMCEEVRGLVNTNR